MPVLESSAASSIGRPLVSAKHTLADWMIHVSAWPQNQSGVDCTMLKEGQSMTKSLVNRYGWFVIAGVLVMIAITRIRRQRGPKQRLIKQMRSKDNKLALQAIMRLREYSWLYDGSLHGEIVPGGNLKGADLTMASLSGAWLDHADLQGARMADANLQETDLRKANLRGADLLGAYLQGANLRDAKFDKHTRLPDGTQWSPEVDIARFTSSRHPCFWRPQKPYLPPQLSHAQ